MSKPVERILVVEDEVLIALDIADMLESFGFEVVGPAMQQEEALELARTVQIDAAFLDVNLGDGKTSWPITVILRERTIPFIFVTAYTEAEIEFRMSDERVLKKPVTSAQMIKTLRDVLPQHERT